jgi:zinc protease
MSFRQTPISRTRTARARAFAALAAVALFAPLLLPAPRARAQSPAPEPRREQLLNGLRVLLSRRPGDAKVWMHLRIHSGAAFDLANKEGTTALLSDLLFPDPTTRQYVSEELGGGLEVRTTYDAVDITLGGNAAEFDRIAELLRNALLQMRLAPDDVQRVKDARLKSLDASALTAAQIADRAARARLFGPHPYARPVEGTAESLKRVERGDLMFARDRFFNPNNSTLAIVGGFDPSHAMIAVRQFFGPWRKSETIQPATFRQPEAPDARTLVVAAPGTDKAEVRVAARGLSRSDKDSAAASLLAFVAGDRWAARMKDAGVPDAAAVSVAHESNALSGIFLLRARVPASRAAVAVESARDALKSLAAQPITPAEAERARRAASNGDEIIRPLDPPYVKVWLDSITYGYDASSGARAFDSLTSADLQRVAARLFGDALLATAVAGDPAQLRAALANVAGGVELAGAKPAAAQTTPAPPPSPALRPAPLSTPTPQPTPRRP